MQAASGARPVGQVLAFQMAVGVLISVVIGGFMAWRLFVHEPVLRFSGIGNVAFSLLPGTMLPVFMMTLGITGQVRGQVAAGQAPALPNRLCLVLPHNRLLRAMVLAPAAALVIGGIGALGLHALWFEPMNFRFVMIFEVAYAAVMTVVVVPLIVLAALGDRRSGNATLQPY